MNASEAFSIVESVMSDLGILDQFGEPLQGMECAGIVAKFAGARWVENEDALEHGRISPKEYAETALILIDEFKHRLFRMKLEKKLSALRLDQIELDLLKEQSA